jgi:hypothetical protein
MVCCFEASSPVLSGCSLAHAAHCVLGEAEILTAAWDTRYPDFPSGVVITRWDLLSDLMSWCPTQEQSSKSEKHVISRRRSPYSFDLYA